MRRLTAFFLIIVTCLISVPSIQAREISKAGQVFQEVKDGVVTIFSDGHGSGFLVDSQGLIVTNNHVVRNNAGNIRVKFDTNQVVEGKIIKQDRENDLAVVWVNLKNIKAYKVLKPFEPPIGEPLVVVGEQVLAVGSPADKETLDKTATVGIVSRFDESVISHDAAINPGNSGGPLFNFDGEIVGINTFIDPRAQSISRAVPISTAEAIIELAKADIKTASNMPSEDLLPDIPEIEFPISKLLKDKPTAFPKRNQALYNIDSRYFSISVITPPQGYRQLVLAEDKLLKHRKRRAKKKGFEISDDEYDYKNKAYYDYNKPVVTFNIVPKPKLTMGSKVINTITFIGAAGLTVATFGLGAPAMVAPFVMGKKEVKKDFFKLSLIDDKNNCACQPLETGRHPYDYKFAFMSDLYYEEFIDKVYVGTYSFDAKCFKTSKPLKLVIDVEGNKDEDLKVGLPEKLKNIIVEDFKPYWSYVETLSSGTP